MAIDLAMSISPVSGVKSDSSVVASRAVFSVTISQVASRARPFLGVDATPLLVVQEHAFAFQLHAGP